MPSKTNRPPFPKGFCWRFHNGQKCKDVPLSTNVINAATIIQSPAASKTQNMIVPNKPGNVPSPQSNPLKPPMPFPTPVKVPKLAFYLQGYNKKLLHGLITGSSFGFRLHYHGHSVAVTSWKFVICLCTSHHCGQ